MNLDNKQAILNLYEDYRNDGEYSTQNYKKLLNQFNQKREELDKELTEKQKEELSDLLEHNGLMIEEEKRSCFVNAFKLGVEIITESLK